MSTESTEVELPALTRDQARALTDKIKSGIAAVHEDLLAAFTLKAWEPLGYANVDEWAVAELSDFQALRVNRDQRREIAKAAAGANLSTRRMAEILGVSQSTATREMSGAGESNDSPVIGRDGKTYTRPPLAAVPDPEPEDSDEDIVVGEIVEDEEPKVPHPTDGLSRQAYNKTQYAKIEWLALTVESLDVQVRDLTPLSDATVTADDLRDFLKQVTDHAGGAARLKKYLTKQLENLEDNADV
jgi:hypothetical protein